jgi:hypothetical protein
MPTHVLRRLQCSEHPAEHIVRRQAVLQNAEFPKECLLFLSRIHHVHTALDITQNRAQRDHQKPLKIVPPGVSLTFY